MRVGQTREVDVGQRVAVDQEERVGADDRQRLARAAGGAKDSRLFPRIAHARAEVAAVADRGGDRLGTMMQVEHEVVNALAGQPAAMRRISGSPATGMAGLARTSVSGRSRVPRPAVRISAGKREGNRPLGTLQRDRMARPRDR